MECTKNGTLIFDGHNYAFWNRRMNFFLQQHGFDVWKVVVYRYNKLATPPIDKDGNKLYEKNLWATNVILSALVDSIYVKVMHCDSTKEMWYKLQNVYEGDAKVKEAKLQNYRGKFEQLKMKILQPTFCDKIRQFLISL
jgi:hypothetical protein